MSGQHGRGIKGGDRALGSIGDEELGRPRHERNSRASVLSLIAKRGEPSAVGVGEKRKVVQCAASPSEGRKGGDPARLLLEAVPKVDVGVGNGKSSGLLRAEDVPLWGFLPRASLDQLGACNSKLVILANPVGGNSTRTT